VFETSRDERVGHRRDLLRRLELGTITPVIDGATPSVRSAVNHPCPPVHPHVDRQVGMLAASSAPTSRECSRAAACRRAGRRPRDRVPRVGRRRGSLRSMFGAARRREQQAPHAGGGRGAARPSSRSPVHERVAAGLHTSSSCWLKPRCSKRDDALIGSRARRAAATNLGLRVERVARETRRREGDLLEPRFATVVPWVVSSTEMPTSKPSVNRAVDDRPAELGARRVLASRCSRAGFRVMVLNNTLSVSVTVR